MISRSGHSPPPQPSPARGEGAIEDRGAALRDVRATTAGRYPTAPGRSLPPCGGGFGERGAALGDVRATPAGRYPPAPGRPLPPWGGGLGWGVASSPRQLRTGKSLIQTLLRRPQQLRDRRPRLAAAIKMRRRRT